MPALLVQIFAVLFFVLMLVVWFCLSFFNRASDDIKTGWQLLAAFAVLLIVAGIGFGYTCITQNGTIKSVVDVKSSIIVVVLMGVLMLLQIVMVVHIYTPIGWDVEWTLEAATTTTTYQRIDYFTACPNNLLLAFYERAWLAVFSFFGLTDAWLVMSLVGVLSVDMAILTTYATAKRIYNVETAYSAFFFSVFLFGFTPWLIVPYSDTFSMPFVMGILYFYTRWSLSVRRPERAVCAVACGLLTGVGFLLKPHVAVMAVAFGLIQVLYQKRAEIKGELIFFGLLIAVAFAVYVGFQCFAQYQELVPILPNRAFPMEHYINTGLSSDPEFGAHGAFGGYSSENVAAVQNLSSTQEMRAVSLSMIKERLGRMGFGGYLAFLFNKLRWITSEGYFYWGLESGFADFTSREPNVFTQFFYRGGDYLDLYLYVSQGVWVVVLLFVTVAAWLAVTRKTDRYTFIIECAVFGLLCFLLIFEGRARYLISYLPCFSLLAAVGFVQLRQKYGLLLACKHKE
ncbi:glycosyltransferase family 39 protein [Ruminococcaceae bacterium OttesenSCG-928-D13]|nr:glycosyltransferase family 39 protein [Ruminococcaceae bacterium OttesenSCG-928-D13]